MLRDAVYDKYNTTNNVIHIKAVWKLGTSDRKTLPNVNNNHRHYYELHGLGTSGLIRPYWNYPWQIIPSSFWHPPCPSSFLRVTAICAYNIKSCPFLSLYSLCCVQYLHFSSVFSEALLPEIYDNESLHFRFLILYSPLGSIFMSYTSELALPVVL
jgi:hypothetical protein